MRQAHISLEALKLRLISSAVQSASDPLLTKDGIHYLLKALAYADAAFSAEIENVLVKAGALAVPELIKGLSADNMNVRSISAMALIRLGKTAEDALLKAYPRTHRKASNRWIFQFILQELCLEVPQAADHPSYLVALERVG